MCKWKSAKLKIVYPMLRTCVLAIQYQLPGSISGLSNSFEQGKYCH